MKLPLYHFSLFPSKPLDTIETEKLLEEKTNLSISNRHIATEPLLETKEEKPITFLQELKDMLPHKLLMINMFSWAGLHLFAQNFKSYGVLYNPDDEYLSLVGAVCGILNGLSRVVKKIKI